MKTMKNKNVFDVAVKVCEECGGYSDAKFCANCGSEIDMYNYCHECGRFVKTTECQSCFGEGHEGEFRVGD